MKFEEQNGFVKLILCKNRHQFHYIRSQKSTYKSMSSRVATHNLQFFNFLNDYMQILSSNLHREKNNKKSLRRAHTLS